MPDIEVIGVRFSSPKPRETPAGSEESQKWTKVSIEVRNNSKRTTYYVRGELEGVKYEEADRKLTLALAELPSLNAHITIHRDPRFTPILPESTVTLEATIPVQMKLLELKESGAPSVRVVD